MSTMSTLLTSTILTTCTRIPFQSFSSDVVVSIPPSSTLTLLSVATLFPVLIFNKFLSLLHPPHFPLLIFSVTPTFSPCRTTVAKSSIFTFRASGTSNPSTRPLLSSLPLRALFHRTNQFRAPFLHQLRDQPSDHCQGPCLCADQHCEG